MRLKVILKTQGLQLSNNYPYALQGMIYNLLSQSEADSSFHDKGLQGNGKQYKLFVFSNLLGLFHRDNESFHYNADCVLYIAAQSASLLHRIYLAMAKAGKIFLEGNSIPIVSIVIQELPYFEGEKEVWLQTLSPITAYRTDNRRVTYFSPGQKEFQQLCLQNLCNKNTAIPVPYPDPVFEVLDVNNIRKRVVHFKNSFYIAYSCRLKVKVNHAALCLIWNTGLSAKGSAGFGMIKIVE